MADIEAYEHLIFVILRITCLAYSILFSKVSFNSIKDLTFLMFFLYVTFF